MFSTPFFCADARRRIPAADRQFDLELHFDAYREAPHPIQPE
jgi:hypothetical protein